MDNAMTLQKEANELLKQIVSQNHTMINLLIDLVRKQESNDL